MSSRLVRQEKLVYEEIKHYLNENRVFELNKALSYIKNQFNKNNLKFDLNQIKNIFLSFLKRKIIVEGSYLVREDILTIKKRRFIFKYIVQNPGVSFFDIKQELNYNSHILKWHLSILLIFDYIYKIRIEKHDAYFDSNYLQEDSNILDHV